MDLHWWSALPFAAMLGCIAILPLIHRTAEWWEQHRNQLAVALVLGVPVAAWMWIADTPMAVADAAIEYGQFMALLLSLFVVSGGIFLDGDIEASPRTNTIFLAIGAVLASFVGTTGAAMLLVRPLLATNKERVYRVHTVLFTIFIVANCGGLLTPLGDPPLFLGFLRGVPFTWTFGLLPEWLFTNALLLFTYYALDSYYSAREPSTAVKADRSNIQPLRLVGTANLIWFGVIILAVALLPSLNAEAISEGTATALDYVPVRELVMLSAAGLSYLLGDRSVRYDRNRFTWGPILEVAAVFVGIFLTMIPALKYLATVAPSLPLNHITFFAFTGGLSSVLDNAPTYATFFEMAGRVADPGGPSIAGVPEVYLVSISLGAVLCGCLTYIGNGPNFMVKSVAEADGVEMPSFGMYIVRSVSFVVPVLVAMVCLFVAHTWVAFILGLVVTAVILTGDVVLLRRGHRLALQDS